MSQLAPRKHAFLSTPKSAWKLLASASLLALCLRLLLLGSKSLWLDEAMSLSIAKAGPETLWKGNPDQYHPPLFYLLFGYWMRLGESEFTARLPSAILGVAALFLLYRLAKDLVGSKAALSASWLSALSPLLVWYSQEARSYSLLIAIGLVATIAVVKLSLRPNPAWWLLFVLAMTAALYTHYVAFLLIPVHLVLLAILLATRRSRASVILFWLAGCFVAAIAYWPWLRTPGAKRFLGLLTRDGSYLARLLADRLNLVLSRLVPVFTASIIVAAPIGLYLVYRLSRQSADLWARLRARNWVQGLLALLFATLLAASVIPRGYTIKRQLVILWPYALLVFGWFWPWERSRMRLLTIILALSLVASLVNISLIPKDQWRETVAFVIERSRTEDVALLAPGYMVIPFDYYSRGRIGRHPIRPPSAESQLESLLNEHERVWLVSHQVDIADPEKRAEGWLAKHANRVEGASFYHIQVELYER